MWAQSVAEAAQSGASPKSDGATAFVNQVDLRREALLDRLTTVSGQARIRLSITMNSNPASRCGSLTAVLDSFCGGALPHPRVIEAPCRRVGAPIPARRALRAGLRVACATALFTMLSRTAPENIWKVERLWRELIRVQPACEFRPPSPPRSTR